MKTQVKKRDYLFDNYKAFLIILVIISHFTDMNYANNSLLYTLKWLIVSFHMPAFIYISGYFSKREHSILTLMQKLLIPYFVYECVYYALYTFILHKETGFYFLYPKFSLWYLLALFVWRAATPYIKKVPGHMLLAVGAGLLIGLSDMKSNFLSIPRILVYYPFFLAGFHMDRHFFDRFRTKSIRILSACGIAVFILFLILDPVHKDYDPKIFYGRYNYAYLDQSAPEGILVRLICYGIGFAMTFMTAFIMTEKQTALSYLGSRTMPIYILHGLVLSCFKFGTDLLEEIHTIPQSLLLIAFCIALAFIGAAPVFVRITDTVSGFPLEELYHKIQSNHSGILHRKEKGAV